MWLADDERTDADTDVRWAFAYSSALSMPIHIVSASVRSSSASHIAEDTKNNEIENTI